MAMLLLDAFMLWVSDWGAAVPLLCVVLTRDRKAVTAAILSLFLTWACTNMLKIAVNRPRPFEVGVAPLIGSPQEGASFPSQHASLAFSATTNAFLANRVLGIIAFVFAVLVAYSRVYLGVHYWSDVFAGAVLGSAIAYSVQRVIDHVAQRNQKKKRR